MEEIQRVEDKNNQNELQAEENSTSTNKAPKKNNHVILAITIFVISLIIAAVIVYYQPVNDYFILKDANPDMVALAQQSGMSKQGELIFLSTKPQFATDAQMRLDCAGNAAANNKNGFIEQGCFVPNSNDHSTGRIYIRQMPPNLYSQEIVTASYEMLHSVYFSLVGSNQATALIQAIEKNYNAVHTPQLDAQVVNFAKTEPGYRDLELFSLLGTEYSNVSPSLASFYAPYFISRSLTVDSYISVTATFKNEQAQLKQLSNTVTSDSSLANTAYVDSIAWAQSGNAYEDAYNYNIYKQYIAQENTTINQYNLLSSEYNTLVTEYNGSQPVNTIQNIQTQAAK